ncbi:MAG: lysophospholipid acyltransferase family protein [Woeseia sp.]
MFRIRVLILVLYFVVTVVPSVLGIILCARLPFRFSFGIASAWAKGMLRAGRLICGLEWVVEGKERLPAEPSVIYIKHASVFEAYAQVGIFPQQTWVVKRELRRAPVIGWGMTALKCIAIDRGAGGKAVRQVIEQGTRRLAEGIWITIFPEGTRMPPGETRRYGISGAALAREAGCMVVPVAHNARDFFPRNGIPERPGRIRICIGPPIDASLQGPKETNRIAQDWIESKMARISEGYRASHVEV